MAAWDVYAEQLFHLRHGLPLWCPEPSDSGEVCIGDVGYIRNGRFYGLFNTTLPKDHQTNQRLGVPQPFEPFIVRPELQRRCPDAIKQEELRSESITPVDVSIGASAQTLVSAQFRYKCSNERGALLRLNKPGHAVAIHSKKHIMDYIRLNHPSWCNFAADVVGLDKPEEEIIFVSGHVKTAEWALVAEYTSKTREGELSFIGNIGPSASANVSLSISHSVSMSVQYRSGPSQALDIRTTQSSFPSASSSQNDGTTSTLQEPTFDQCIFLNYYKLKSRRFRGLKVIQAAAGPHELPHSDDDDPDTDSCASTAPSFEEVPDTGRAYDPVEYLLDYILSHSDVNIAIACDADFITICKNQVIPSDIPAMLERVAPKFISTTMETSPIAGGSGDLQSSIDGSRVYLPTPATYMEFLRTTQTGSLSSSIDDFMDWEPELLSYSALENRHGPSTSDTPLHADQQLTQFHSSINKSTGDMLLHPSPAISIDSGYESVDALFSAGFPSTDPLLPIESPSTGDRSCPLPSRPLGKNICSVLELALAYASPADGPFVPQKTYRPHTQSDRRRYVEEVQLAEPIMFIMQNPEACGIVLRDALTSKFMRLVGREDLMFEGRGPSVSIRLMWPGYAPWSRQIPTRDFRTPPLPITRSKLAKNVAKTIQRFISDMHKRPMEDGADPRWRVGEGRITVDDLVLVGLENVSMGSWQAHVRLRRRD
ncbi:hypothetical protein A0H81_06650 [Grifola frondosa]|uniref:Uncharacterized protein n=1 Tax=Grifola frondosa TaxID=5627 RepID=A0A1C7M8F0_GRIFR|nr:hypothetical protein A0H81_06650 [Grifola frondosa]